MLSLAASLTGGHSFAGAAATTRRRTTTIKIHNFQIKATTRLFHNQRQLKLQQKTLASISGIQSSPSSRQVRVQSVGYSGSTTFCQCRFMGSRTAETTALWNDRSTSKTGNYWRRTIHNHSTRHPLAFASSFSSPAFLVKNQRDMSTSSSAAASPTMLGQSSSSAAANNNEGGFFSETVPDFASLGIQSPVLLRRVKQLGFQRPTSAQAEVFQDIRSGSVNITLGAETGSGKTLAYLLPLMDDILQRKQKLKVGSSTENDDKTLSPLQKALATTDYDCLGYDFARALILVPNKELTQQVIRMALPLAGGPQALVYGGSSLVDPTILKNVTSLSRSRDQPHNSASKEKELVRLAIFPGGLKDPMDFPPFRQGRTGRVPPVDLIVATPATLGEIAIKPKHIGMFADIATLVIDEADMLMDGGYIRALEKVLTGFRRADKLDKSLVKRKTQHVFVAATLPDSGSRSVDAFLSRKFPKAKRITVDGMHMARHSGLAKKTAWMHMESKKERMEHLCYLLETPNAEGGLLEDKVMVFLNTVKDAEGACEALIRAGFPAVGYHANLPLPDRGKVLDKFRRYQRPSLSDEARAAADAGDDNDNKNNNTGDNASSLSPSSPNGKAAKKTKDSEEDARILVCTDLAARGLDVPGVTAIVELQFALNVVSHLHRMGRCGRAGQRVGRGIVYYSSNELPLVDIVRRAEDEQDGSLEPRHKTMVLEGPDVVETPEEEEEEYENDKLEEEGEEEEEEGYERDMQGAAVAEGAALDDKEAPATVKPRKKKRWVRKHGEAGTVARGFSRRRGLSKRRKKMIRAAAAKADDSEEPRAAAETGESEEMLRQ
ncbi:hypothetical protein ACA910_016343 [Epithemia clementina (nom. ined.)]